MLHDERDLVERVSAMLLAELTHDYPGNPLFRKELEKLTAKISVTAN